MLGVREVNETFESFVPLRSVNEMVRYVRRKYLTTLPRRSGAYFAIRSISAIPCEQNGCTKRRASYL